MQDFARRYGGNHNPQPQYSYVEALPLTVYGIKEVIKVKWGHKSKVLIQQNWCLYV